MHTGGISTPGDAHSSPPVRPFVADAHRPHQHPRNRSGPKTAGRPV